MNIIFTYIAVVMIWATTPLAIHWSNDQFDFLTSISARIVLAAVLGWMIAKLLGIKILQHRSELKIFAAGALGLFPTMLLVYFAAQVIPSGLMSVLFGMFPLMVGFLSQWLLKDSILTPTKIAALGLALIGLVLINIDQLNTGKSAVMGVLAMLLATLLWALSSVWLKRLPVIASPFRQSIGSLLFVAPLFSVVWLLFAGPLPTHIGLKSASGMAYLVVAGSLLGHTLFLHVLNRCGVLQVSLIPLITPVIALFLGYWVEGESFSGTALMGAVIVFIALLFFQGLHRYLILLKRWFN